MRLFLSAALAALLLCGAAFAAEPSDEEILSDLVSITAAPRPSDVKMVVQAGKPAPAEKQDKTEVPAQDPPPVKTAAK